MSRLIRGLGGYSRAVTPDTTDDTYSSIPASFPSDVDNVESPNYTSSDSTAGQLQSDAQADLLSALDRLRKEHIDAEIGIPQIVVCGDQSSGKSSVLQAIANVPFPVSGSTTTRFATEVILRQAPKSDLKFTIVPAADRTRAQREYLRDFSPSFDVSGIGDFGRLIDEVSSYLLKFEPDCKFWSDWLRAEISGPNQPHLTLIDLPGIIQTENGDNSLPGDRQKIKDMVRKYIDKPRTILLAVINAQNDFEMQEITDLIGKTSYAKSRTLGVITRPDRVEPSSDQEAAVLRLARNERHHLGFGWHVLRNLSNTDQAHDATQRDEVEAGFFATAPWSQLDRNDVEIARLREKLSRYLFECIAAELPALYDHLLNKSLECNDNIKRLGPSRDTPDKKRAYLSETLMKLQRLVEAGLDGEYEKDEFGDFFNGAEEKALRDRITNDLDAFAEELRDHGRQFYIYEPGTDTSRFRPLPIDEDPKFSAPYTTKSYYNSSGTSRTQSVDFNTYYSALAVHMKNTRGRSLPGSFSHGTIKTVFRQLSVPWDEIARKSSNRCWQAVQEFLKAAVCHTAQKHTGDVILQEWVYPRFDEKNLELNEKVTELLWPYQKSHPMTYNPQFGRVPGGKIELETAGVDEVELLEDDSCDSGVENKRRVRDRPDHHQRSSCAKLSTSWYQELRDAGYDNNHVFIAVKVFELTERYYEIALDTFIENFATLAVERCLLGDLRNIFPADKIVGMDDETVDKFAAEPIEDQEERARLFAQQNALEDVIRTCRRHMTHGNRRS